MSSSAAPPENIKPTIAPASSSFERERADHRDQRDRVDSQMVVDDHSVADLDSELESENHDGRAPDLVARSALAREVQQPAAASASSAIAARISARCSTTPRSCRRCKPVSGVSGGRIGAVEASDAEAMAKESPRFGAGASVASRNPLRRSPRRFIAAGGCHGGPICRLRRFVRSVLVG